MLSFFGWLEGKGEGKFWVSGLVQERCFIEGVAMSCKLRLEVVINLFDFSFECY